MARRNSRKKRSTPHAQPTTLPPQQQQPPRQEAHDEQAQQQEQQQAASDHDPFADEFFSQPATPPASDLWEGGLDVAWDDAEERPRIAPEKRRAMVATAVIFGTFAVLLGSFTVYSQVIMPTPVALGASSGTFTLPTPIQMEPRAEVTTPTIAAAPTEAPSEPTPVEVPVVAADVAPVLPPTQAETRPARIVAAAAERGDDPRSSARPNKQREVAAVNEPDDVGESAMRALNAGNPRDARRLAQQAVTDHPERANGWIVLGAANDALGDHAAALTAYANCSARASGARVAACRALAR